MTYNIFLHVYCQYINIKKTHRFVLNKTGNKQGTLNKYTSLGHKKIFNHEQIFEYLPHSLNLHDHYTAVVHRCLISLI